METKTMKVKKTLVGSRLNSETVELMDEIAYEYRLSRYTIISEALKAYLASYPAKSA